MWKIDKPAVDALQKGLHDIQDLCDIVTVEFQEKNKEYSTSKGETS